MKIILPVLLSIVAMACNSSRYYYVVRHAERLDTSSNSILSAEGSKRAQILKDSLLGKKIDLIFTTSYERTKQTAQPLADALQKQLFIYKPNATDSLVTAINNSNKNVLIVGHSNTVPLLVEKLSGQKVAALKETEFDNLYIIIAKKNKKELIHKKYGKSSD